MTIFPGRPLRLALALSMVPPSLAPAGAADRAARYPAQTAVQAAPALDGEHPGDPYGHTSGPEWAGWGAGGFFNALGATALGKGPYGPYGAYGPPGFKQYGYYVPAEAGFPRGGCYQQYPIYDSYGRFRGYRPVPVC